MKRIGLIVIVLSVILIGCNGQNAKQKAGVTETDTAGNPQTSIKVNRQYDNNGNLVKFDSTYSYFYSKTNDNKNLRDSIYNNFRNQFRREYTFSSDPFFNDLFFQDSLLKYDFYKKDFFTNRFRNNMMMMDSLFWGMDSLKNSFFNKQFKIPEPLKVP
jgi:hypothetical protein